MNENERIRFERIMVIEESEHDGLSELVQAAAQGPFASRVIFIGAPRSTGNFFQQKVEAIEDIPKSLTTKESTQQ